MVMKFINLSYEDFLKRKGGKKIVQFGASTAWSYFFELFPNIKNDILNDTLYIVDNDKSKQGKEFGIAGNNFLIQDINTLYNNKNYVILIVVSLAYHKNICEQLKTLNLSDNIECYSLPLMTYRYNKADNACIDSYFSVHKSPINKTIIHSFWFSGEEKPDLYKKCIESWHKYCTDFEIIEWNAHNYDVKKNKYMFEAFEQQKWAFVSDYARLDVIYNYGGIYMDMDVELLNPIDDLINTKNFFCRQEDGLIELGSGFGALQGDNLIGEMLETYKNRRLILDNGEIDKTPQPAWLNNLFKSYGIYKSHDSQIIEDRVILSNDYITCFSDSDSINQAKLGIHWHNGGWLDEKDRELIKKSKKYKNDLIRNYFKL